jgi:hypothetical protein
MGEHMHALVRDLTRHDTLLGFIVIFFEACYIDDPIVDEQFEINATILENDTANYKLFTRTTLARVFRHTTIAEANQTWKDYIGLAACRGAAQKSIWIKNDQWETVKRATRWMLRRMTKLNLDETYIGMRGDCSDMPYWYGNNTIEIDEINVSNPGCPITMRLLGHLHSEAAKTRK